MLPRRSIHRRLVALFAFALILQIPLTMPHADAQATIIVNTADGNNVANGDCSLAEAILAANTDAAVDGCAAGNGADTILLISDVTLTTVFADYDGETGLPEVEGTVTIDGAGFTVRRDAAAPEFRIISAAAGSDLTVQNITLTNGALAGNSGNGGGAIRGRTVSVINSSIISNTSANAGGIYAIDVTVQNSTIADNRAEGGFDGAGINTFFQDEFGNITDPGPVTVTNSTVSNNFNTGASGGGIRAGAVTVTGSTFENNVAAGFDGGAIYSRRGSVSVSNSTFAGNRTNGNGGAIYSEEPFTPASITNSVFTGNQALGGAGAGGALYFWGQLNIDRSKFVGNSADRIGDAIASEGANSLVNISQSCLAGNGDAFHANNGVSHNLANNYWGSPSGPSGIGSGDGDALSDGAPLSVYEPFLTLPNFPEFSCPTVVADFYSTPVTQTLIVAPENGVLANDIAVLPNTASVATDPDFGTVTVNPDGSFTYAPNSPTEPLDGFRYRAQDLDGAAFIGLVCITRTNLQVTVPPTQTTTVNTPIPIPNLSVQGVPASTRVRVDLSVSLGTIDTGFANTGVAGLPPSQECKNLIDQIRVAGAPDAPAVVQAPTNGIRTISGSGNTPGFVPYFQQPPPAGVSIQGNNTANVIIEGPVSGVNAVLANVTYVSPTPGVDNLVIVANDGGGGVAAGQVTIIINAGAGMPPGGGGAPPGGGGSAPPNLVSSGDGGNDAAPGVAPVIPIPLGPLTLFEISQIPNSVVRGEATTATVANGDVFVQVVATNGTLVVGTEQIGDPFLTEQPIFNGAEVFGLTLGGVPVQGFDGDVTVCLRGFGTFYYRDATAMPRTTVQLVTFRDGDFTCATIPNSGTIVLVSTGEAPPEEPAAPNTVSTAQRRDLPDGCMVTTDAIINLREGPGTTNGIIRRIPFDVTLTAFQQEGNWYYVDYWGVRGWMSADFVRPNTRCGS